MRPADIFPGAVVDQRFVIDAPAGSGGMGAVYRARDLLTGRLVALKLIYHRPSPGPSPGPSPSRPQDRERFAREAAVLAALRHPGIVGYAAHGHLEGGASYLAMEWLDGIDLADRLARGPLTLAESVVLLTRVAEALTAVHDRGILHRDLKPSNIYLAQGQVEQPRLLDFGLVRIAEGPGITGNGQPVGTPEYMAPEQADGCLDAVGPAADIFSLGCVFYECLVGQPAFSVDHLASVLAKLRVHQTPHLRLAWPQVPPRVEALVGRMLARDSRRRPADAKALLRELFALGELPAAALRMTERAPVGCPPRRLTGGEQRLFCLIVAAAPPDGKMFNSGPAAGLLTSALADLGAQLELHVDGSLIATLLETGCATDQAVEAARCALVIHAHYPQAWVALATGRGVATAQLPVGEVRDRALAMVRAGLAEPGGPAALGIPDGVLLDPVSAGLLDARFVVDDCRYGPLLRGEQAGIDEHRLLFGKLSPCIGRDHELRILESALTSCIEDGGARAVLLTAHPGLGKSRLRQEFLRRLRASDRPVAILFGRAEPLQLGSPYAVIGQALRQYCGQLATHLTRYVDSADAQRVGEFLGELCQLPSPDAPSVLLQAARGDPKLMAEQYCRAFVDWLRAECRQRPVLIILEDLQWGDLLTARLLNRALSELSDEPLLLIALARPEVLQQFPKLWSEQSIHVVHVPPLTDRASQRLVAEVLGDGVPPTSWPAW